MSIVLSDLFLLGEAFENNAIRAEVTCNSDDLENWISGNCTSSIRVKQYAGKFLYDLVGTTDTLRLISSRVLDVLSREGITGWASCPVVFESRKKEIIDGYSVLATTGRCGPLENGRSKKISKTINDGSKTIDMYMGFYFDEQTWDGSDMFRPVGTRMTIVTRRVKDAIDKICATNLIMEPLLEVERLVL